METVTLTRVFRKNVTTSKGAAINLSIKTKEHGDKWISGFQNESNKDWAEGQQVQVEITQNGQYLNYKTIKGAKSAQVSSNEVIERLKRIESGVSAILAKVGGSAISQITTDELEPDETTPF